MMFQMNKPMLIRLTPDLWAWMADVAGFTLRTDGGQPTAHMRDGSAVDITDGTYMAEDEAKDAGWTGDVWQPT